MAAVGVLEGAFVGPTRRLSKWANPNTSAGFVGQGSTWTPPRPCRVKTWL